jgi:hypothetical protein
VSVRRAGTKNTNEPLFLARAVFCILLTVLLPAACGEDGNETGGGYTNDVGEDCLVLCYDDWCGNNEQVSCSSLYCIGPADETYCTTSCDFDEQCPAGYFCSVGCTHRVAPYPVCIKEENRQLLIDLEYCPEEEG